MLIILLLNVICFRFGCKNESCKSFCTTHEPQGITTS